MYALIGARIKKAREKKFISQAELGARLGVTATAINYYEKGKRKINIEDLFRLAAALEKPVEYFLPAGNQKGNRNRTLTKWAKQEFYSLKNISVLGTVQAGEPLVSTQMVIGCLPLPQILTGEVDFALQVQGDSMVGEGICDGDLVLIRRQSHVDFNGQIICALIHGKENTLKKFVKDKSGKIYLCAANPVYPPIILNSETELVIQGVYAGVFKFPSGSPRAL
jgi:repressor LexA